MKLLCFSDLHRDREAASQLVDAAVQADVLIGAGDFANQRKGVLDTLQVLSAVKRPAILVPGNGESTEELTTAAQCWPSATVLHASGTQIDSVDFYGVGGGIPVTPFGSWSYDFDESRAESMLEAAPQGGILVVHSPPIDTVDHDSTGTIRGSQAIRDCIERTHPKLVVCGHIHSDWGKQIRLGETTILNAGPAGTLIDLDLL